jgi:ElaB/YqjD/DUF883 family membrane-anchored ribosome-binding protein
MSETVNSAATTPHPLVEALDAEVASEVSALLEQANSDAAEIVAQARRRSRRRFRAAAAQLRNERAAALAKAQAKAARARHQVFLAENARLVEAGLADIEARLSELWNDPKTGAAWCRNAIALACARLGDIERFTLEHPDPLPETLRAVVLKAMSDAKCRSPSLRPDPTLRVGVRLRSEHACLDATPTGLMIDRAHIAGEYLAVLGRGEERHDG